MTRAIACASGVKLQGLRDAAKELVNIVVNDNQSAYTSRVALVPFSTRIRVAANDHDGELMGKLTGLPTLWSGWLRECIRSSGGGGGGETEGSWTCTRKPRGKKSTGRSCRVSPSGCTVANGSDLSTTPSTTLTAHPATGIG